MNARSKPEFTAPEESEQEAYAEREQRQAEQEGENEKRRRTKRLNEELEVQRKIIEEGIKPLRKEGSPMRQLNVLVTWEQHDRVTSFARKNCISLKDLILTALKPIIEKKSP